MEHPRMRWEDQFNPEKANCLNHWYDKQTYSNWRTNSVTLLHTPPQTISSHIKLLHSSTVFFFATLSIALDPNCLKAIAVSHSGLPSEMGPITGLSNFLLSCPYGQIPPVVVTPSVKQEKTNAHAITKQLRLSTHWEGSRCGRARHMIQWWRI